MIFSASSVSTFEDCNRKWAFDKIEGVSREENEAAKKGKEIHAILEAWLRDGTAPDFTSEAGEIAAAGLHLLPAPKTPGMTLEEEFKIIIGGYDFHGYKDVEILATPIVYDHKSTGNFENAKEPLGIRGRLVDDVQATLYAADAMHKSGSPWCDLQWTYFRTKGARKAEPVRLRVTREDVTPRLEKTVQSAARMAEILESGKRAADLEPNTKSCDKYGGCPYLKICNPYEQERAPMASVADILKKAREKTAQNGINPPPVEPEPPPPAALAPEASAVPTTPEPEKPKRAARAKAEPADDKAETLASLLNQCARLQEITADILRTAAALSR